MNAKFEFSPRRIAPWHHVRDGVLLIAILISVSALYLTFALGMVSFSARHERFWLATEAAWRPIPTALRYRLYLAWARYDRRIIEPTQKSIDFIEWL